MDDGFEAVGVEELEVGVRDEAANLDDLVLFGIQACHLFVWLKRVLGITSIWRGGVESKRRVRTSQSIHTSGSDERANGMLTVFVCKVL